MSKERVISTNEREFILEALAVGTSLAVRPRFLRSLANLRIQPHAALSLALLMHSLSYTADSRTQRTLPPQSRSENGWPTTRGKQKSRHNILGNLG